MFVPAEKHGNANSDNAEFSPHLSHHSFPLPKTLPHFEFYSTSKILAIINWSQEFIVVIFKFALKSWSHNARL